jgi:predicted RNA binding protein YcfA (HicA-like mRNA interferase family)
MNGKKIIKKLKAAGFIVLRTEGSHCRLGNGSVKVSVPVHGAHDIKPGTLASIEKQSGVKLK